MKIGIREGKEPDFSLFSTENCSVVNAGETDAQRKDSIKARPGDEQKHQYPTHIRIYFPR